MIFHKYLAEFVGTAGLVAAVVGSGTMATNMSSDKGVDLLINSLSTVLALALLILVFAPISGSHFNPLVTLSEFMQRRLRASELVGYLVAQFSGGLLGTVIANLMFKNPAIFRSHHIRTGINLWLGEVIATAGLLFLIQIIRQRNLDSTAPIIISGWIGSAYLFTSSTSFANPAVTLARAFTNTFSGIALGSVAGFVTAQIIGALIGALAGNYFKLQKGVY